MLKDNWLERQLSTVRELVQEGSRLSRTNKLPQAETKLREAEVILDSAEDITDPVLELRAVVYNELGVIATRVNDANRALNYHQKAIATLEEQAKAPGRDLAPRLAGSRLNLGGILAALNKLPEAEEQNRRALELLEGRNDESSRLMRIGARQNLGTVLFSRGRIPDGVEEFNRVEADVDVLIESGSNDVRFSLIQMLLNTSVARLRVNLPDDAVRIGEKAARIASDLYEQTHDKNVLGQVLNTQMHLVTAHQVARNFDRAENALFTVLEVVPGHPEVIRRGQEFYQAILQLSDDELEQGGLPRDEAEESLEEINEMLTAQND